MSTLWDIATFFTLGVAVWYGIYSVFYAASLGWHTAKQKRPMNVQVNLNSGKE